MKFHLATLVALAANTAAYAADPQTAATFATPTSVATPDPFARFKPEIAAFAARDATDSAVQDSTLFIGSSSIRHWNTAQSFPTIGTINRGFGGSTTADVLHFYPQVIGPIHPASVVVYIGENDIGRGASADTVIADVLTLMTKLRQDMPKARIVYLSLKPTPSRWKMWPTMVAVNAAIQAKSGALTFDYLDVGTILLDPQGLPKPELFAPDKLHLNDQGYALWTTIVDGWLKPKAKLDTPPPATHAAL